MIMGLQPGAGGRSLVNSAIVLLLVATMFPYLKTSSFSSDVQAHVFATFFLLALLAISIGKIDFKDILLLLSAISFVIVTFYMSGGLFDYTRIVFFFLMIYVFLKFGSCNPNLVYRILSASILVYFVGSLIQLMFGSAAISGIVSNLRFSDSRGLSSFTSEPSFLGLVSLSQIVLLEVYAGKHKIFFQILAFVNLILCAALSILLPALLIIFLIIIHKRAFLLGFIIILLSLPVMYLSWNFNGESRAISLGIKMLDDPIGILENDVSGANRFLRSFSPVYLAYIDNFALHEFGDLESDVQRIISEWRMPSGTEVSRLSNVMTYFIYPYGWFGVAIIGIFLIRLMVYRMPIYLKMTICFFLVANISIITPFSVFLASLVFFPQSYLKHALYNTRRF